MGGYVKGNQPGDFIVSYHFYNGNDTGFCFMHELGHTLDLSNLTYGSNFEGVDSKIYTKYQYPSCMNYCAIGKKEYEYSEGKNANTGTDFDDWSYIKKNMGMFVR